MHLLHQAGRGRRRGEPDRPPRRALLRDPQPLPVHERPPDGGAVRAPRPPPGPRPRDDRRDDGARPAGDAPARGGLRARTATTSASTRAGSPAPASSTTSTCTSSRAGAATPTSCRCSPTRRVMPQTLEQSYEALKGRALTERTPRRRAGSVRRDLQGLRHPRPLRRRRWTATTAYLRRPRVRPRPRRPARQGGRRAAGRRSAATCA